MPDTMLQDIIKAELGIMQIYSRRKAMLEALCNQYAAKALASFRRQQTNAQLQGIFWTNRTVTARNTVFSGVEKYQQFYGFFLAHAIEYGVYLELANNAAHEALRPIIHSLYSDFMNDLKELFGADSTPTPSVIAL